MNKFKLNQSRSKQKLRLKSLRLKKKSRLISSRKTMRMPKSRMWLSQTRITLIVQIGVVIKPKHTMAKEEVIETTVEVKRAGTVDTMMMASEVTVAGGTKVRLRKVKVPFIVISKRNESIMMALRLSGTKLKGAKGGTKSSTITLIASIKVNQEKTSGLATGVAIGVVIEVKVTRQTTSRKEKSALVTQRSETEL